VERWSLLDSGLIATTVMEVEKLRMKKMKSDETVVKFPQLSEADKQFEELERQRDLIKEQADLIKNHRTSPSEYP